MKNLYARFVLWLIRPAVKRALREETRQGALKYGLSAINGAWTVRKDGSVRTTADEASA